MPSPPTVTGYTGLTQQTQLVLENNQLAPGEVLLLPEAAGAGTMSLTTQPNSTNASPTTGMQLHIYVIGNTGAGTIGFVGTDIGGNAQTSQTYHVAAAPLNGQGYTEFTTKEIWATINSSAITLTSLTPCRIIIFGSPAGKFLVPITANSEEKIENHDPQDKRGILWGSFRITQLTKGAELTKFDCSLYPDMLWAYYMLMGLPSSTPTVPASPNSLLAATTKAATMTLTTSLSTVPPGMFLIFTIANSNILAGTIVLSGVDAVTGLAISETITVPASNATVYSTKRYASINNSGADKFATTGLTTGATIAVTAVFGWTPTWTYDGANNPTPLSACLSLFDGVMGKKLPGAILTEGTWAWEKQKEIMFTSKGEAQDYLIIGDPNPSSTYPSGTNPFATLAQPTSLPIASWPGAFYIDPGAAGTPLTTQDGSMLTFKVSVSTGRKWDYAGDTMQRGSFVKTDSFPKLGVDSTMIFQNYAHIVNYFKQNKALILGANFRGALLGSYGSSTYFEGVQWTIPAKMDTLHVDQAKNDVEVVIKHQGEYSLSNLGFAYRVAVTCQVPPTYLT